jgi:hypothetical protein
VVVVAYELPCCFHFRSGFNSLLFVVVLCSGQQPIVAFHGSGHSLIRWAVALKLPGRKNFILKKTVLPSSLHKKRYP